MLKNTDIFQTFQTILQLLNHKQKKQALYVLLVLFCVSIIELLSLALFLPVIQFASDPSSLTSNSLLSKIYDFLDLESPEILLILLLSVLAIIFILKNLALIISSYIQNKYAMGVSLSLSKTVLMTYQNMEWLKFQQQKEGDIMYDIYSRSQQVINSGLLSFIFLTYELMVTLLILISIALYNWQCLILLILVIAPMMCIIYIKSREKLMQYTEYLNVLNPLLHSKMNQCIHGYIDAKLTNSNGMFLKQFTKAHKKICDIIIKNNIVTQSPARIIEISAVFGIIILAIYANFFHSNGSFTSLVAIFGIASFRLMPSAGRVMQALAGIKKTKVLLCKYDSLLKDNNVDLDTSTKFNSLKIIFIQNLTFAYTPQQHILNEINFQIKRGEKIGIIGESGSGKSTLANLLLGLLKPTHGQILIDNQVLHKDIPERNWQESIGYIKQKIYIADTSIMGNVAFGKELNEINERDVWDALKKASLDQFVRSLPDGLHTQLGEHGSRLSGGQQQRIGIARAIYKKPQLLIMDEATSALDNKTESEIANSIENLMSSDLTIIIIAHRYSTLKSCGRIIELANGKLINEFGFDQLIARSTENNV